MTATDIAIVIIFLIDVWVPVVGNTADTPNHLWVITLQRKLGSQSEFDIGGV